MKIQCFLLTLAETGPKTSLPLFLLGVILYFPWAIAGFATAQTTAEYGGSDFKTVAKQIDARLAEATDGVPDEIDDATFLSRAWLDLVGIRPAANEIEAFQRDNNPHKRNDVVQQLLADSRFGQHWGRYWRDVILARRADERALRLVSEGLAAAVAERINHNARWDQIATDFITASGDVRSHGETGLLLAQKGEPEGITAEVARIFLGIQIQCAQCHDHPTDQWKREQFHQLAAFFPRVGIRPVRNSQPRNFEVYSRNHKNKKGDGKGKNKKPLEYFMPNLENPEASGLITKPVFFLTGHSLELGTADQDRREALANWLTDAEENPWFARAYVNRLWTELIGDGFYDSVDDIGPERNCRHPEVLSILAENFIATGYDINWLFQTIIATAAYQSAMPMHGATIGTTASQPLRSDAVFDNLVQVLEIDRSAKGRGNKKQKEKARQVFQQAFFYDPSLPRDEINPTIPQALLMMNSRQINQLLRGDRRGTMLARLLAEQEDNTLVVASLYLRCLGRLPTDQERSTCLKHIKARKNRSEACEDILWSLLNTAEFRRRN